MRYTLGQFPFGRAEESNDFWVNKNITDKQVLFDLYHELALLIVPLKGYSHLLASADLSDQDRRRMGASPLENAEILESLKEAFDAYLEQYRKSSEADTSQNG